MRKVLRGSSEAGAGVPRRDMSRWVEQEYGVIFDGVHEEAVNIGLHELIVQGLEFIAIGGDILEFEKNVD